jgi:hypothetical protein
MDTKFVLTLIFSLATAFLIGCASKESQSEQMPISKADSVRTTKEKKGDTLIVDEEWMVQLIELVEAKSMNLKPDSIRPIKNLHRPGVIDTLRFVGTEGFTALIYSVTYDGRQVLWESTIHLESDFGRMLWRDLSSRHSIRSKTCTRVMDFEATNEVRIFCDNDGVDRFIYCSLHRE